MLEFIRSYLTVIMINMIAIAWLLFSLFKSKEKTKKSLKAAFHSLIKTFPAIIIIIILIGFLLGFLPQEIIWKVVGDQAGFLGILLTAILGSVLFIPAIMAFPLSASLLDGGASIMSIAAFITTLTMVGIVTLPLELKELGRKITILRNLFSFLFAIVIALIMGGLL